MGIFHVILSVPQNIIMDLNNVILTFLRVSSKNNVIKVSSIHTYVQPKTTQTQKSELS
jgi:hypothetical protein